MITIKVTENSIEAKGHADYAEHGHDIICSAISILMQTLALKGHTEVKESGYMIITTDDKQGLELIVGGLKLIANNKQYGEYVEIIEE